MPMFVKTAKRVKDKLPMITPGVRDNSILPSSGGASNSGITLDYSAINVGGVDNGVPYNHVDDASSNLKAVKAPDFTETGIYLVETSQGTKRIYRDPENREWYEDTNKHYSQSWLGSTKQEALDRLNKMYNDTIETNEADDITVYHGSSHKFDTFNLEKARVGEIGKALYFSENSAVSKSYGDNLVKLTISPKKPLDFFKMTEAEAIALGKATGVPADFLKESVDLYANYGSAKWAMCWWQLSIAGLEVSYGDAATREALAKFFQKNGYDAVCFPFHSDNSRTWAVFDPSIITIKKDDKVETNEADDEEEGEKYHAYDLTSNWWVADHRIKLHNKLWERATALLWPWVNKVQLTRMKQKDDGSWEEVHKVVDADDILILLPLENHQANDLYSTTKETPSSLTKIPTDTANNSYVGRSDEGFNFRHNLDYGATAQLTAAIIKGNVKYVKDNPVAEAFYNDIENYLISKGYVVSFETAESDTLPEAQLRIGHSKGLNKLNLCKNEKFKLLAIGALPEKSKNDKIVFVNHPEDEQALRDARKGLRFDIPINEHYIFTNAMKRVIDLFTDELLKEAGTFLNLPQYSDPNMYQQVLNPRNEATEPLEAYDIAETYFADDENIPTFNKKNWFDWEANKSNFYGSNGIGLLENELPIALNPKTNEKDINEWIKSFQVRFGIPPKLFPILKDMVDVMRKVNAVQWTDDASTQFYQLLRQYAGTDQEWIEHITGESLFGRPKPKSDDVIDVFEKEAFPDYTMYNSSPMYELVSERPDANTTQHFDIWNTYYVDDKATSIENRWRKLFERRPDLIEKYPEYAKLVLTKQAFIKNAVTYDSNSVIQDLIKIPQVKALIDQQASGYVDSIIVTTPSADFQQTQQRLKQDPNLQHIQLEQPTGNPYGHMLTYTDPSTHQKKSLDKIVRIDRVTDAWGTLNTILHEIAHHRHPDWSEAQVESEAQRNADTVKQFLNKQANTKQVMFVKSNLRSLSVIDCEVADTYQKQVIGLQNHTSLNAKSGMLFPYKNAQTLSFWMGKVSFPIDIIFADNGGKILKIYRNCQPNSTDIYSCANASKVIEVIGSFCAFHDLDTNDHIFEADDEAYKHEDFAKYIMQLLKDHKLKQQEDLNMEDWNIKLVMKYEPDSRKFIKVNWTSKDYQLKKADILINPDPILINAALKKMPLDKLVRHALLHILAGVKHELPEDKEKELITNKLFKEADK